MREDFGGQDLGAPVTSGFGVTVGFPVTPGFGGFAFFSSYQGTALAVPMPHESGFSR